MKPTDLPGINGLITNSLALNREITRAINFLVVYRSRNGTEPAAAVPLSNLLAAAAEIAKNGTVPSAGAAGVVTSTQQIPMTGAPGFTKATITVTNGVVTAVATA